MRYVSMLKTVLFSTSLLAIANATANEVSDTLDGLSYSQQVAELGERFTPDSEFVILTDEYGSAV